MNKVVHRSASRNGARRPGVVFQPAVASGLRSGAEQIVAAVRATLGPTPRLVAVAKPHGGVPELLDSGAVIARRIVALPDRSADVGAMYVRSVIWKTHEEAGDGTATTAVIFRSAFDAGLRWVAAGGDPSALRFHLERASELVLGELGAMSEPIGGKERLTQAALAICSDRELAALLGEIFDVVGPDGQVDVRAGTRRTCDREYVEGMHWPGGVHSALFISGLPERRVVLENAGILISDLDLAEPEDVRTIVAQARAAGLAGLVIVAQRLSDRALGVLTPGETPPGFRAIAVKTPGTGETARFVTMQDLALLTGGRVLTRAAGDRPASVRPICFGRARIAWADRDHVGVVGGKGDPRQLRRHVARLRLALREEHDDKAARVLRERLAKLLGGSATLWIGGTTESEVAVRRANAARTAAAMRGALNHGVVPGGGAAFLACRPALTAAMAASSGIDERAALRLTMRALEEPTRTIVANAGADPDATIGRIVEAGPGMGYDARTGLIARMADVGVVDSAAMAKAAVRSAIGGAAQALTIGVLVHHRLPEIATEPL